MTACSAALTPLCPKESREWPQLGGEEGVVWLYYPLLRGCCAGKTDCAHLVDEGRFVVRGLDVLVFVPIRFLFRGLLPNTE